MGKTLQVVHYPHLAAIFVAFTSVTFASQGFCRRPRFPKLRRHARNTVDLTDCTEDAEKALYVGCASGPLEAFQLT